MQIQSKFDPGQKVWINRIPYFRGDLLPLRQEEVEIACIEIWRSGDPCKYCPFKSCRLKEYADRHNECCGKIAVYFLTQAEMAGEKPHNETKPDKK